MMMKYTAIHMNLLPWLLQHSQHYLACSHRFSSCLLPSKTSIGYTAQNVSSRICYAQASDKIPGYQPTIASRETHTRTSTSSASTVSSCRGFSIICVCDARPSAAHHTTSSVLQPDVAAPAVHDSTVTAGGATYGCLLFSCSCRHLTALAGVQCVAAHRHLQRRPLLARPCWCVDAPAGAPG
jgi:hypothetical protein